MMSRHHDQSPVGHAFRFGLIALFLLLLNVPALAQERVDEEAVEIIRSIGLEQSEVMTHAWWLSDVYGPRLTASPNLRRASDWLLEELESWGLEAYLHEWGPFGKGWELNHFTLHVDGDVSFPVLAHPRAWTVGTEGPITAELVLFNPESEEDFSRFEGQLEGKIVLFGSPRDIEEHFDPPATRRDAENLLRLAQVADAGTGGDQGHSHMVGMEYEEWQQSPIPFLLNENPAAVLDLSSNRGDYGVMLVSSAIALGTDSDQQLMRPWQPEAVNTVPQVTLAAEHFNRLYRLLEHGMSIEATLDVDVTWYEDDLNEYNVIAEIPGTDPEIGDEVVMLGAHLDSWHSGTGATDNASGSSVMMEAMRILTRLFEETDRAPRRTIRMALWTGEEQGLHGSRHYVADHFAEGGGRGEPPEQLHPDYDEISAYYNYDNGTGRIRGIYAQGNEALRSIFGAWLEPFHDLDATVVSLANTGSTDHIPFDRAGIPGFQFIQDPIAYRRTHHSNMDVFDRLHEDDLSQAATIIASFVYHTAQRDELLPRKPMHIPAEQASH